MATHALRDDPTAPLYESAALVTVDVQADTLDGQPLEIPGTSAVLPNMARLSSVFRAIGRPIVHMLRLYNADGSNAELCRRSLVQGAVPVLRSGTPGRALAPDILAAKVPDLDDDLLLAGHAQQLGSSEFAMYKPRWGAFYGTNLDHHLRSQGVTTLIFAGCNFPNCPRTSVYEASERDYRLVLVEDAVSGLYEQGGAEMRNIGVHLHRTDDIVGALSP